MDDFSRFASRLGGEVLMQFDENVVHVETREDRLFVTLASGKIIDVTDLMGEPKH